MDTIVAIATSIASPAGINIIRISGEKSLGIAKEIFENKDFNNNIIANKMYLGSVKVGQFLERAFCVYYRAPKSYTGEDVVEIHCHGGKIITEEIVKEIRKRGARPSAAGEFTKRAFLNDKLTLDMAEGIYGIINAVSESDLNNSYRIMEGEIGKGLIKIEQKLIGATAILEAYLDYPEELEDNKSLAKKELIDGKNSIEKLLETTKYTKILREGVFVAIVGLPNSGKSSLLNALVKQDRAIVSEIAGTTRDILSESIEIEGIKINFVDTAGIRKSKDTIEEMGIERAKKAIKNADIVIFVQDTTTESGEEEREIEKLFGDKKVINVANKIDINKVDKKGIKISAKRGDNIAEIVREIMRIIDREAIYNQAILTNEKHIYALERSRQLIADVLTDWSAPTECVLVDIKNALDEISKVTGRDVSESVVDEIFAKFCVGK